MTAAPISIQLYTLREEAAKDFPAVIERLGRIGYVGVEPAGFHDLSPAEFKRRVDDAGMVVSSGHAQMPLGSAANEILDAQETIGNEDVVVAFLPPDQFADRDAVRKSADKLNAALENVKKRGMRLGYHNHYWEFSSQIDGQSAHSLFFELLDPEIFAEIDTYWARVGGADPASVISKLGERARLLHVKDGPADSPESDMTAVGDGAMDIATILAAGGKARWHIVELDRCATDMFEAVERSHAFLVGQGLSQGRTQ